MREWASLNCSQSGYLRVKPKERYLSHEEVHILLAACSGDLRDLIMLSLGTGMRVTEVLTLDRDHTNLQHGVVTLVDTKNGDRRLVPLPSEVVTMLQQRPTPIREWFPKWNLGKLTHAFVTLVRKTPLAGTGVSFHTLRHIYPSGLCRPPACQPWYDWSMRELSST